MFYKIDFSIAFSCKIYPEILDFRFSILYLCSVQSPQSTRSLTEFLFLVIVIQSHPFVIQSEAKETNKKRVHPKVSPLPKKRIPIELESEITTDIA